MALPFWLTEETMPRKFQLESLEADLAEIEALLEQARSFSDPLGTVQYGYRKTQLERQIADLRAGEEMTASVALLFGGAPVFGMRGIDAEFAGKAIARFQDLVSRVYAKSEWGALGARGPVPLKSKTALMVTEIARGSFGFVLDEMSQQASALETSLKGTVSEVSELLDRAALPDSSDFESLTETLDGRTLAALTDLFSTMSTSGATVRIVTDDSEVVLDSGAINRGLERTKATSIEENDAEVYGRLQGFLPTHKKFEFVGESGLIYGLVSTEAADQFEAARAHGRELIGQTCGIRLRTRTIKPLNRPPRAVNYLLAFISDAT
ncbi:MAG: hypothetical protein M0Z68_03925 [Gammaproteobacteria bacterium]|jgi:hypothetical protein|nr:hypothetical protein [Gammaproteobacteria bacterium]